MRPALIALLLVHCTITMVQGAEPKPIDELKVCGLTLGMTHEAFAKIYPNAPKSTGDQLTQFGSVTYMIPQSLGGCMASASFYKGKIYRMVIIWNQEALKEIGGMQTVTEKIVEKYGKAHPESRMKFAENHYELKWIGKTSLMLMELKADQMGIEMVHVGTVKELDVAIKKDKKSGIDD